MKLPQTYTPKQVSNILQISKATVYNLIDRGELIAKKIGNVYRIPPSSISFALTGLDYDLYRAEKIDLQNIKKVQKALGQVRKKLN